MTLKSMTAFGSATTQSELLNVTAEIKTLNSRFVEVNVRLPRSYMHIETSVIKLVKSTLKRGKVDVSLDIKKQTSTAKLPSIDIEAVNHYLSLSKQMISADSDLKKPTITELMKLEGVLVTGNTASEENAQETELILSTISTALDKVIKARTVEGASLKPAFIDLIAQIDAHRKQLIDQMPDILAHIEANYLKKLEKAVENLKDGGYKAELPPTERVMGELAILVDKADIEEELTRLATHTSTFLKLLEEGEGMGRKLDFMCQELHREVNTISSKLHQSSVAPIVLDMKQVVEKIRQQIQNIE